MRGYNIRSTAPRRKLLSVPSITVPVINPQPQSPLARSSNLRRCPGSSSQTHVTEAVSHGKQTRAPQTREPRLYPFPRTKTTHAETSKTCQVGTKTRPPLLRHHRRNARSPFVHRSTIHCPWIDNDRLLQPRFYNFCTGNTPDAKKPAK